MLHGHSGKSKKMTFTFKSIPFSIEKVYTYSILAVALNHHVSKLSAVMATLLIDTFTFYRAFPFCFLLSSAVCTVL